MRKFWMTCASLALGFAVGHLFYISGGCSLVGAPTVEVAPPITTGPATPEQPKTDKPKSVEELEKELIAAKKAEVKAHQEVEAKQAELDEACLTEQRHKLYWVVGWSLLAALGCVVGAIYLPGVRKYFVYGVFAAIAVAALAITLASILEYLPYVGVGLLVLALFFAIYCWRNDHKGLRQVASAVEAYKSKMPGYKEHFKQFIDTDVDGWLNRTRKHLGLLKK